MADGGDPGRGLFRVLVLAAILLVGALAVPMVSRWYQCQQLAPIERLVTRGC